MTAAKPRRGALPSIPLVVLAIAILASSCAGEEDDDGTGARAPADCACEPAHGLGSCENGACVVACFTGFADCDGAVESGCETTLASDPANCGSCGEACSFDHAVATCADAVCGWAECEAGFASCDQDQGNGCEVDLARTSAHCGACGHDCGQSPCVNGTCGAAPEVVLPAAVSELVVEGDVVTYSNGYGLEPDGGTISRFRVGEASPTELVGRQDKPWWFAKDATGIYWCNIGVPPEMGNEPAVMALPAGAAAPIVLAPAACRGIAVDAARVYIGDNGSVSSLPKAGGAATALVSFEALAADVAPVLDGFVADDTDVYVAFGTGGGTSVTGRVARVPKNGGAPVLLASFPGQTLNGIAIDDAGVYVTAMLSGGGEPAKDHGLLLRVAKAGGDPATIASGLPAPYAVTTAGGFVFLTNIDFGASGRIQQIAADGLSPPVDLAVNVGDPRAIAVSAGFVYFTGNQGLSRVPF